MIETLNQLASIWWPWMWQITLQASILIVLVYLLDLATRRWVWPQLRLLLWLLVLLRLLLPPSLSSPWSVTAPVYTEASQLLPQSFVEPPAAPMLKTRLSDIVYPNFTTAGSPEWLFEGGNTGIRSIRPPNAPRPDSVEPSPRLTWQSWLLCLWATVSLLLASFFGVLVFRLRKQVADAAKASELADLVSTVARAAGLKSAPDVRISAEVATPAVLGLRRPVILIPPNHTSVLSPRDLRNALLHEMCHIKRRDLLLQRIVLLIHALYWCNPLLWIVRRRIRHLTEMCCDARVVRILRGETEGYRATILRALRPLLDGRAPRGWAQLGLLEHPDRMTDRLNWLSRAVGSRLRLPVAMMVSLLAIALVLPMVTSSRAKSEGFTVVRVTTFTPVGNGQSYLAGIDLTVAKSSERSAVQFRGQFTDPGPPREITIVSASERPLDKGPDCAQFGGRLVREEEVLGHRTLVFQYPASEVYLAPEFRCLPLKVLSVTQDGVTETKAVRIRTDSAAVAALDLPGPSEGPQKALSGRRPGSSNLSAATPYAGVRAAMSDQLDSFGAMPLTNDYVRAVEQEALSVVWDQADSGATSRVFPYAFSYEQKAAMGPDGEYFLTRAGTAEIHRCDSNGRIVEALPFTPPFPPAFHRSFSVDSSGRLCALLQSSKPRDIPGRGDFVRVSASHDAYTDIFLSPPALFPLDFSIDAASRFYILRWNASVADARRLGQEVLPPSSRSLSVDRYSPGGELERSLSLDPVLAQVLAPGARTWLRPASLAVLDDGRTFVLLLSDRTEGNARVTSGRLYTINWRNSTLRPIRVEPPAEGLVALTDIHALRDSLVLEWSDYTSIPDGQLPISIFALKRLQLWRDGATEPLVNLRGIIAAVSADQALVSRTTPGGPDTPSLFLVTFR